MVQKIVVVPARALVATTCGLAFVIASTVAQAQHYSAATLKQEVANFLAAYYQTLEHERIDIKVGNVDSRLRLTPCPSGLSINPQDATGLGGNISVQVRCTEPSGWTVYVPSQIAIHRHIPVAARAINRGEQLTEDHLAETLVNVSSIREGYALNRNDIIGREAKRPIAQGEPLKTSTLAAPTAVRRGDSVTLQSQAGSINVVSAGVALADGRLGQKIRVRNSSSDRIVTGVVVNQGVVQTL